jgi:hypothetical protein
MATRIVPGGEGPLEERIQCDVPYSLWHIPQFPINMLGGRLDKDPEKDTWLQGLYEDLKSSETFRNPVFVWNHHAGRLTGKQPSWLLRAGSNRVWCAEQLGWTHVPAIVSTVGEAPTKDAEEIAPYAMESYLNDPGVCWANDYGFGLLQVARPEDTYAENTTTNLRKTTHHLRTRLDNIRDVINTPGPAEP